MKVKVGGNTVWYNVGSNHNVVIDIISCYGSVVGTAHYGTPKKSGTVRYLDRREPVRI